VSKIVPCKVWETSCLSKDLWTRTLSDSDSRDHGSECADVARPSPCQVTKGRPSCLVQTLPKRPKGDQGSLVQRLAPKFLKLMLNCCRAPALASKMRQSSHLHPVLLHSPLHVPALTSPTILLHTYLSSATTPSIKIAFNSYRISLLLPWYCSYENQQPKPVPLTRQLPQRLPYS
jgi:hypothetical protein